MSPAPRPAARESLAYRPQPRQADLLRACGLLDFQRGAGGPRPPLAPVIGYGGAAYGGKSYGLLGLAGVAAYAFPGCSIAFFRRTYEELRGPGAVVPDSHELFSSCAEFNATLKRWHFPHTGSNLYFRYAQHESDVYKYQSQQVDLLLVDEATHMTWFMVDYLLTRNRATVDGVKPFAVFASNPGNVGHAWYSQLFDVNQEQGAHEQVKRVRNPNGKYTDAYFIPAFLQDNPIGLARDPEYGERLAQRAPEVAAALLEGDWSLFAGQAFREFERERHTCQPFEVPPAWPVWRAVDEGYTNPWCCLWFAQDPDSGRVYVVREAYQSGLTDRQQARTLRALSSPAEYHGGYLRGHTYADPSMFARKQTRDIVTSSADEYRAEGVPLTAADNDRVGGKRKVHRLLRNLPDGRPGLLIFRTCANLVRTLPHLPLDERNPEDVDTRAEDHAYDALRYGLTNLRGAAGEKQEAAGQKSPFQRARSLF